MATSLLLPNVPITVQAVTPLSRNGDVRGKIVFNGPTQGSLRMRKTKKTRAVKIGHFSSKSKRDRDLENHARVRNALCVSFIKFSQYRINSRLAELYW